MSLFNFIILCGGSGSRLWPKSRTKMPKQLLRITNEYSMLQNTILRTQSCEMENSKITIICNKDHYFIILEQIQELKIEHLNFQIITEPCGRNSAPAICISSLITGNENTISIIMPCDHILDAQEFKSCFNKSFSYIDKSIVTFGVIPNKPETGYGYIKVKFNINMDGHLIQKFIEKPCLKEAQEFFESGNYFWNAGIFIFKNINMIRCFEKYAPDILESSRNCISKTDLSSKNLIHLSSDFLKIRSISIDYAIMELLTKDDLSIINAYTIPYISYWSDIGSYSSLYDAINDALNDASLPENESEKESSMSNNKNNVVRDLSSKNSTSNTFLYNVSNSYIDSEKSFVAVIGVDNLVVVNTDDALLICNKDQTQDVKKVVDYLNSSDKKELTLEHKKVYRPWGFYVNVYGSDTDGSKIKKITVYPGKKLSLQSHNQRSEHWVITRGVGKVQVGQEFYNMTVDSHIYIPQKELHRIENVGDELLEFTETQIGTYLGEDDIIRYEDDFGRV